MTLTRQNLQPGFMQFDISQEKKSYSRVLGHHQETERPQPNLSLAISTTSSNTLFQPLAQKHQRIHSLILGARQVEDNGSVSGVTNPYLPKAPSLFRDDSDSPPPYHPSPLQKVTLSNRSPGTNRQKSRPAKSSRQEFRRRGMPHAVNMAQTGFQVLILCGPGIGLSTFTNTPQEYPKALVPIANRPMIWYVLDWCYRMGVTDITIVTPPTSKKPIETALAQNPDLTSLPLPKPDLLAPTDLEFNTPTAELLRLPEIQDVIKSDFLLLPCDLVCDIPGDLLLETYLTSMAGMAGTGADFEDQTITKTKNSFALGAEGSGRRGGLSVWYNTVNREESIKKEECDFMATVEIESQHKDPIRKKSGLSDSKLRKLVWTTPMSELLEESEENKSWKIRQSLLRRYGAVKCMTKYRDAHIYFFPHWVKEFAMQNEEFESISEDLVGKWAKSDWRKPAYRTKIGATKIFKQHHSTTANFEDIPRRADRPIEDEIDLLSLSSTQVSRYAPNATQIQKTPSLQLASRVQGSNPEDSMISTTTDESTNGDDNDDQDSSEGTSIPFFPPILSYILPSSSTSPLVRRVDSTPLLLSISLLLAKLPALDQPNSSPFSQASKLHSTSQPPPTVRVSVSTTDSLVASNTTLNQHCSIKQSCVGMNCVIGQGARIQGCVVMDGAQIGEKAVISGSVIGKKAIIGKGVTLKDCEVQDGMVVGEGTDAKNEKFLVGGFEEGEEGESYGGDEGED